MLRELQLYLKPRLIAILLLGFVSGLPLALTASTLGIWLTESGIDKTAIGLFAAVATPYALKFLWSPLMDGIRFPVLCAKLGQRSGWMIATQLALMAGLFVMGGIDPAATPWLTAAAAFFIATASASQDIVIDAYRVEILKPDEQGAGAAMVVLGYRFGMIASTAGALYLAEYFGWQMAYCVMGLLLIIGMVTVLVNGEPEHLKTVDRPSSPAAWLEQYVAGPFREFMTREHWLAILFFILLFKFGDAFMGVMNNPFFIEIGFSKTQIANIVKLYGLTATIAGSFIGGAMVHRLGMMKSLWICGILQGLTNLVFVVQAQLGTDAAFLAVTITLENLSGGMGTAAFVAYISVLCNQRFTATQYALLSSLASVGRTWFSTPAGYVAETLGWQAFFVFSALLALPGLAILWWLQKRVTASAPPAAAT